MGSPRMETRSETEMFGSPRRESSKRAILTSGTDHLSVVSWPKKAKATSVPERGVESGHGNVISVQ